MRPARARWLHIATAVLTAGLAVAAASPAVEATFPGRNGRIAFTTIWYSAEANGDYREIVSIRPDGSAPRLLARQAKHPAYRPDGGMIVFARGRGIFLMRANGTAKRRLVGGPYTEPDWAPDGRRLVLTRTRTPRGIVTWRPGGQFRWLTNGSTPAWSPTGRLIAFTRADRPYSYFPRTIYVVRPDGSGVRRLAAGWAPEWSPDGRRIIFTRDDQTVRSIRPNGTGLRRIAPIHAFTPVYSPNGRLITYSKGFLTDASVLTMRADGRRRTRIFNVSRDLPCCPDDLSDLDWQPLPRPPAMRENPLSSAQRS
jgi:Tol biopolymer transport system component